MIGFYFLPVGCVYAITVPTARATTETVNSGSVAPKDPEEIRKSVVDRAVPAVQYIQMPRYDTAGLTFFAIRPVDTSDEYLSTLRLAVFPLHRRDQIVLTHDFSVDSMLFLLTGPKLASIVGHEYILRLESALDPKFYTDMATQDLTVQLRPGVNEHFQFSFHPKMRSVYPESVSACLPP
ncbi:unnamed protein product [Echinostoma caproni]|uniref:NOMO C-terminal transthyretin-like domain-containing protein n=1 Tax=Echinostoma caproni TaxID=27848 RepID=A0A3P8HX20_9TREM|nr:unnamed protein product [Echinostoma caproni]